jgi:hypothetical protein
MGSRQEKTLVSRLQFDGKDMKEVEHLTSPKANGYNRSRDGQHLAEIEAADRLDSPGEQAKNIEGRKTANQCYQDVVDVVGILGKNQRLEVSERHRRGRQRVQRSNIVGALKLFTILRVH